MKKIVVFTLFAFLLSFMPAVNAAGVTMYTDLTAAPGGTPSTITTEAEIADSSADDVYFAFQAGANFASDDTVTLTAPTGGVLTFADCSSPVTDADGDSTPDGSGSTGGTSFVYTFSAATTTATTGVEFCVNITTDATPSNDVVLLTSSRGDTGAAFVYSGNDNDIAVTADVGEGLNFVLRNTADNADTNACALGTLATSTVSTCDYRIGLTTNSENGADVYIDDTSASPGLTSGANDINAVTENDTVTAGSEEYGIGVVVATVGGTMTETGDFTDDDTPIPTSKTQILNTDAPFIWEVGTTTTSTLITHSAAINAATAAGSYTQTVSYYVTANY